MMRPLLLLVLATSATVATGAPSQVHLAFAGSDSTGRTFSWYTPDETATSTVQLWTAEDRSDLQLLTSTEQSSYGWGWHHHVKSGTLSAGTRYHYAVGDEAAGFSEPLSFTTKAASDGEVNLAIFGDWGYLNSSARPATIPVGGLAWNWTASYTHTRLQQLWRDGLIDSVFHVGDVSYADDAFGHVGELRHFNYEDIYSAWMDWISPVASALPYMVSPGNHEAECHSPACVLRPQKLGRKLNNFTAFNTRWRMPSDECRGIQNMWYSWRQSNLHIVSVNTETDQPGAGEEDRGAIFSAGHFGADGDYIAWLEADLAAAAADPTVDWIIAGGHRWSSSDVGANVTALFQKYGVDLFFAGHAHSYTRNSVSSDGVVHITVGGAGNDEHSYPDNDSTELSVVERCRVWCNKAVQVHEAKAAMQRDAFRAVQLEPLMDKTAADACQLCSSDAEYFTDQYAIGVLSVTGKSLAWTLYKSEDGTVLDTLRLSK